MPIPLAGVRDALLRRLHRIDYDAPWRDVVGGGLFFFVWGRVLWSLRRWEALGEFAGRWWLLLGREVVEAGFFLERAQGVWMLVWPPPRREWVE